MVRFTTFGGIDLRSSDDEPIRAILAQPQKLALLAYLAASSRGTPREREEVRAMFWPEYEDSRARHSLNQALHVLRGELGRRAIVSTGRVQVAIDAAAVASDVELLYRAHRAGDLETVNECYRGEFLPAFFVRDLPEFDRWLDRKRAHVRLVATEATWKLALIRERAGDLPAAVSYARHALELSPYDEGAVQRVLQLLNRVGDRASARRVFNAFASSLRADLDIEPSLETVRLARSLVEPPQRERAPNATAPSMPGVEVPATAPTFDLAAERDATTTTSAGTRRAMDLGRRLPNDSRGRARHLMASAFPTWIRATALVVLAMLITRHDAPRPAEGNGRTARTPASQLYREGRAEWNKRTPEALRTALRDFSAVLQRDTLVAEASSGISDSYAMLAWYGVRPSETESARARAVAEQAAMLRPDLAETHASLGAVYGIIDGDTARARAELSRAIALNGADAKARDWYAFELAAAGDLHEALTQMRTARSIEPDSPAIGTDLATLLFWARQYDGALDELRRVAVLDPTYEPMHRLQWRVYSALGMHQRALGALQTVMRDEGRGDESVRAVRQAYESGDWTAVLERRLEVLEKPLPNARRRSVEAAVLTAQLGQPDSAVAWLSRARGERNVALRFAWLDPALQDLRDDPRVRAVLGRD